MEEVDEKKHGGLPTICTLMIGMKVINTTNTDVKYGIANGTTGILKSIHVNPTCKIQTKSMDSQFVNQICLMN